MGGSSGGGASTPYEAPINLQSAQRYKAVHAVSEGVVSGFGNETLLKSLYFNDTPVQSSTGELNFKGIEAFATSGEANQSYVPEFDSSENTKSVATEVKYGAPVNRTVSDPLVSRLRVTVAIEQNTETNEKGDTHAANTSVRVELVDKHGKVATSHLVVFTERASGPYYQDTVFTMLPEKPFTIRVSRDTPDAATTRVANKTHFASYVEVIDIRQSHPHTALLCLKMDSAQFGSSAPRVNILVKGMAVRIPSNYNPETREYSGIWDGSFKSGWTDNPAWILYDILTGTRYSTLARRLNRNLIDVWALYEVAKYCDVLVDDGQGGKEPRFSCHVQMMDNAPRTAADVVRDICSAFMGMGVWNGSTFSVFADHDADPVYQYANSNVVEGKFVYGSAAMKQVTTAIHIKYADKTDGYRAKTEYVSDDAAIQRYGLNIKTIEAFGCTSRTQALRVGQWILNTGLMQQETVSFSVGRDGLRHRPFDIIRLADNEYAGTQLGGRITAIDGKRITLDAPIRIDEGTFTYQTAAGALHKIKLTLPAPSQSFRLPENAETPELNGVWALSGGNAEPTLWRAITIAEDSENGTFSITAVKHDPGKYALSERVNRVNPRTTLLTLVPEITNVRVSSQDGSLNVKWDNAADGESVTYDVWLYRDKQLFKEFFGLTSPDIRLNNLPNGDYRLKIVGINARGIRAEPVYKAFSLNYDITALRTTPKTLAVDLVWTLPAQMVATTHTELWYAPTEDFQAAKKLVSLPYPQNTYTLTGVAVTDKFWFWARLADNNGHAGKFTPAVAGEADKDPAPIVAMIQGQITESALAKDLLAQLDEQSTAAAAKAVQAPTQALQSKLTASEQRINALAKQARTLGSQIRAVQQVNQTQAEQINTVSAARDETAAALARETAARIEADAAEAAERQTLASQMGQAVQAAVENETKARTAADKVQTEQLTAATSRLDTAEGRISSLQNTVAEQQNVVTAKVDNLTSRLGAAEGRVETLQNTVAQTQTAVTTKVDNLTSRVENTEASVQTAQTATAALGNKVQSLYSVKVQAVGNRKAVAGVSLGADGQTGDSQFLVMADKFALVQPGTTHIKAPFVVSTVNRKTQLALAGDMIVDGTIQGRHIAAGQTIQAPSINGGTLSGGTINGGSLNIGNGQFKVDSSGKLTAANALVRGRIEATDGFFNGTVRADKIEGQLARVKFEVTDLFGDYFDNVFDANSGHGGRRHGLVGKQVSVEAVSYDRLLFIQSTTPNSWGDQHIVVSMSRQRMGNMNDILNAEVCILSRGPRSLAPGSSRKFPSIPRGDNFGTTYSLVPVGWKDQFDRIILLRANEPLTLCFESWWVYILRWRRGHLENPDGRCQWAAAGIQLQLVGIRI